MLLTFFLTQFVRTHPVRKNSPALNAKGYKMADEMKKRMADYDVAYKIWLKNRKEPTSNDSLRNGNDSLRNGNDSLLADIEDNDMLTEDEKAEYREWFKKQEAKKDSMLNANKGKVDPKELLYLMNGVKNPSDSTEEEETEVVNGVRMSKKEAEGILNPKEKRTPYGDSLGKASDIADRKSRSISQYPSTDMFKKDRPTKEELDFLKAFLEAHKDDFKHEQDLLQ